MPIKSLPIKSLNDKIPLGFRLRHTLRGHKGEITRIAWSPDGRTLASPSFDSTIQLWNAETGALLRMLEGHSKGVSSVAWSPDGKSLASSSYDNTIRLWDAETGVLRRTLEGHSDAVFSVAWSPDGRTLASGSHDNTICLWDAETGVLRRTLEGHSDAVFSVAWSPDGRSLASGSRDNTIRLWDAETGELRRTIERHSKGVLSVAWLPDGQTLASGSSDNTIRLWDPKTRRPRNVLEGHTIPVKSVSFSSDGRLLASKSSDDTVRLWRCDTWEVVTVLHEPTSDKWLPGLAFHPKAPVLATLGEKDRVIRIWDLDLTTLLGDKQTFFSMGSQVYTPLAATNHTQTSFGGPQINTSDAAHDLVTQTSMPSSRPLELLQGAREMDRATDAQSERNTAASILQRKIETGDFDVFLCYNSEDKPAVKKIGERLKERGILPWLDEWELRPGLPWQRLLEQQIAQIKSAAVFVGKEGMGPWQHLELEAFLREFIERGCPVIPVLLPDAPKKPKLPIFLKSMTWVDFGKQDPDPMERLIWGITGKRSGSMK